LVDHFTGGIPSESSVDQLSVSLAIKDVATPALTAIAAANFRENMSIPQSITRYI